MPLPPIVAIDGFLAPRFRGVNIGRDLDWLKPLVIGSKFGTNLWWPAFDKQIANQVRHIPEYLVVGYSMGAHAAARLAYHDFRCKGLIFISGTRWKPIRSIRWEDFPVLCLSTENEKDAIVNGTHETYTNFKAVDAYSQWDHFIGSEHRRPHLRGIKQHRGRIQSWLKSTF